MRYTTKIRLPVERGNFHSYTLSYNVVQQLLEMLSKESNIVSVEWENGDCVATVEMLSPVTLEPTYSSLELFARDIINQNSGKN